MAETTTIQASDFQSRNEIDAYVRNELGDDVSANRNSGYSIAGKLDDLKRLMLSESSRIYGVPVILLKE